jgi:mgtE-like transporter
MGFAMPLRRLVAFWRADRRTLRQALVALALSTLAGFGAGLILAHISGTLETYPELLVLIPAAVGMRGTIFGSIGARLGTANATGTLVPSLRRGGVLADNASVALLTTLSSSLWLAILARAIMAASGHRVAMSFPDLIMVSVVGGVLGSLLILALTIALSAASHRRGWDIDSVATPMVTALGDVATLPTLYLATLLLRFDALATVLGVACVVAGVAGAVRSYTSPSAPVRRVAIEMTAVIALTPILDVLAGGLLRARDEELLAIPVLLVLIPPFVSQAGAVGGIFSSRITSKLQLGVIAPRRLPEGPAILDASAAIVLSVVVYALIGVVSFALADLTSLARPSPGTLIAGTILAGVLVTPLQIGVAYYLAIATFRFGLDPDNHSVPVITSVMDLAGVTSVLAVMGALGVLPRA